MNILNSRSLLLAGAVVLAGALALPALCQTAATANSGVMAMAQAERPLPVRIDASSRYLFLAPGTASKAPDPAEAQRINDALERHGFRMVHERKATAQSMANGVKRVIDGGVRPENISVLAMGDSAQVLIDVAQQVYNPKVNYILIAGCENRPNFASRVPLKGRVLSLLMEKPDGKITPSCRSVFAGRAAATGFDFEEITIRLDPPGSTGNIHELAIVEAVNAWTGSAYDDDGVR